MAWYDPWGGSWAQPRSYQWQAPVEQGKYGSGWGYDPSSGQFTGMTQKYNWATLPENVKTYMQAQPWFKGLSGLMPYQSSAQPGQAWAGWQYNPYTQKFSLPEGSAYGKGEKAWGDFNEAQRKAIQTSSMWPELQRRMNAGRYLSQFNQSASQDYDPWANYGRSSTPSWFRTPTWGARSSGYGGYGGGWGGNSGMFSQLPAW